MSLFQVPVCYRFCPTERELVELFLIPKAKGLALPEGHRILERPLYGDEAAPWKVFSDNDPWEWFDDTMKKKIIYVFSRVIAKNGQSKNRTVRTAGCGTWDGKAVGKPILGSGGSVVGSKRAFTFKPKKEFENETRGKWIMHEYSLVNTKDCKDGDVVVCRISNHVEKEGSGNEDEGSGLDSDGESNKRVKRRGVSAENQKEGGQDVGLNTLGLGLSFNHYSNQQLNGEGYVVPCRTGVEQKNVDREIVPYPIGIPQYQYGSEMNERPTPIYYEFFK